MTALAIFMVSFFIIIVVGMLNEKIFRIPMDIALVLISAIFGVLILLISKVEIPYVTSYFERIINGFSSFSFSDFLLHGVICFMLFAGASKLHFSKFVSNIKAISLMSLLTTVVFAVVYGGLFWLISLAFNLNVDIWVCILLGCILSPTEPRAVVGVLEKLGISKGTATVIESESLFNDGTGVALFVFVRGIVSNVHHENFFLAMFKEILGAALVAFVLSYITFKILKATRNPMMHIVISLFNVSCAYVLCEIFGFSGDIASVICGIYYAYHMDQIRRQRIITDEKNLYRAFWNIIDSLLNSSLFVLIGLSVMTLTFSVTAALVCASSILIVIVARAVGVSTSTLMIGHRKMPGGYSFSEFVSIMTWTALRGGMSLALVLSTKDLFANTPALYNILLDVTYVTILFTVIFQGLTSQYCYRLIEKRKAHRLIKKGARQ